MEEFWIRSKLLEGGIKKTVKGGTIGLPYAETQRRRNAVMLLGLTNARLWLEKPKRAGKRCIRSGLRTSPDLSGGSQGGSKIEKKRREKEKEGDRPRFKIFKKGRVPTTKIP